MRAGWRGTSGVERIIGGVRKVLDTVTHPWLDTDMNNSNNTSPENAPAAARPHVMVGSGALVHLAYSPTCTNYTACGAGGRRRGAPAPGRVTVKSVTCSKCAAQEVAS